MTDATWQEGAEPIGLNERMQRYRAEHMPSPEVGTKMGPALQEIEDSGRAPGLQVGDSAPDFELLAVDGSTVRLSDKLKEGPVVLVFYRGEWCAYCNMQIHALQESYGQVRALGADIVAISPQLPQRSDLAVERHGVQFAVASDEDFSVIEKYGLLIDVDGTYREAMTMMGRDLVQENADGSWRLPAPGTFVIDRDGTVVAVFSSPRYWTRMEPEEALEALRRLRESG
jgi:peroxiredoxin